MVHGTAYLQRTIKMILTENKTTLWQSLLVWRGWVMLICLKIKQNMVSEKQQQELSEKARQAFLFLLAIIALIYMYI